MKKKINIFNIIFIMFILLNVVWINTSFAAVVTAPGTGASPGGTSQETQETQESQESQEMILNPDDYDPSRNPITTDDAGELLDKVGVILGTIRNISTIVAVISLMLIGFRYIMGSVEEKANYKATMWPYVIGCIMAVAGTTIVTFIYNSVT